MDNFHISPKDPLAPLAAPEVRRLHEAGVEMVAIRGQSDPTGWHRDMVYIVSEAPHDWNRGGYLWTYVSAADWLREYDEIAAGLNRRRAGRSR